MNTTLLIVVAIVVLLAIVIAFFVLRALRHRRLQERFGPEYDRMVRERGDRGAVEKELSDRMERREKLQIRDLPASARERYLTSWRSVQARFVDDPRTAVGEADGLIGSVMRERGYPVSGDFHETAAEVSVDHAGVVGNYREAHDISERSRQGNASTDDLRRAMVLYRSLFSELVGEDARTAGEPHRSDTRESERRRPEMG